jgi:hypothetical protein
LAISIPPQIIRREARFAMNNSKYQYGPLDASKQQIRLLKIEKSTASTHPPRCTVHVFDLESTPRYIALSYTWGPPNPSHRILVDSGTFQVLDNLYNFLCEYRKDTASNTGIAYIYIDQICIDQSNIQERNSQVRLMSDIYTRSSLVLVWLGNDPKMVRAARRFVDEMENADGEMLPDNRFLEIYLSNPYFNRVWIVQEVSLAKKIRLLCGSEALTWEVVEWGVRGLDQMNIKAAVYPTTIDKLFKEKDVKNRRLDEVVATYSRHNCQDLRDKVYGFLGLVPECQRSVVDYAKSTHQVFVDVVPIVLRTYWENKHTEQVYNDIVYGHLRVYLENLLKLAWNMKFPDHDQRGLIAMFEEFVQVEDQLSKDNPYGLSLTDIVDGFGYEPVNTNAEDEGRPGILMGRWWMEICNRKEFFECRTMSQPLRLLGYYPRWDFLHNVQKNTKWPGKEAMEASQQRLLDPEDPYPWDSEDDDEYR